MLQPSQVASFSYSRKSFENIESWVKSVKESTDTDPIMILVGTQKDLER
jgi:GTPase SAR1 family protein